MENPTLKEFDDKHNLIKEYLYWKLLVRNRNMTLGNCVAVLKRPITKFSDATPEETMDFHNVVKDIEYALKKAFKYNAINYLMLMMKDKEVHVHIIPRYNLPRTFAGLTWTDEAWPGPPGKQKEPLPKSILKKMKEEIIKNVP